MIPQPLPLVYPNDLPLTPPQTTILCSNLFSQYFGDNGAIIFAVMREHHSLTHDDICYLDLDQRPLNYGHCYGCRSRTVMISVTTTNGLLEIVWKSEFLNLKCWNLTRIVCCRSEGGPTRRVWALPVWGADGHYGPFWSRQVIASQRGHRRPVSTYQPTRHLGPGRLTSWGVARGKGGGGELTLTDLEHI